MTSGGPGVPGPRPARPNAPHGESAVRAALVEAGGELFASRGPARVSVREVAERAGVNHGLVHHYFGSKDGLLAAVLDQLASAATEEMIASERRRSTAALYAADGPSARHGRIVAHVILEGRDPAQLKTSFPSIEVLVQRLRNTGMPNRRARERAAQVLAVVLGWQLFEPFLTAAAGLDVSDRTRRRMLDDTVRAVMRAPTV